MVIAKKLYQKLGVFLVFAYLALFPFGQLLRTRLSLLGSFVTLHPVDLIAGASLFFYFFGFVLKPKISKLFGDFFSVSLFSLLFSLTFFPVKEVFLGSFYLLRLVAYFSFSVLTWNLIQDKKLKRGLLLDSLILITIFVALFGWIQYLWLPDLTSLKYIGWDDHLFRLVGSFLDPGFTSLILVLGFVLSSLMFSKVKKRVYLVVAIFLLMSIAFTYARVSYLALVFGLLALAWVTRQTSKIIIFALIFLSLIFFLPRPKSEGVRLERTASLIARLQNYRETGEILWKNPLFGVGFNNLCAARLKAFAGEAKSHACSGSDSSLLFVVATTGLVGFCVFSYTALQTLKSIRGDIYGQGFLVSSAALLVSSFFINSLFYPWLMGFMGILLATSLRD